MEHIVVHKGADYHSAFPDVIRLSNGELVTVYREAAIRPAGWRGSGYFSEAEGKTHHHVDPESRIVLIRSTDDGRTWEASSRVVMDSSDGAHDLNMPVIAEVASGELIVNNHRWRVGLTSEEARSLAASRVRGVSDERFGESVFDSLYVLRSTDMGHTWGEARPFGVSSLAYASHTGKRGVVEMPDSSWLLIFNAATASAGAANGTYVVRSHDQGRSWVQPSEVANDPDNRLRFVEPSLIRLSSGRILSLMRGNEDEGYLYQAHSTDGGWVWEGVRRSPIWGFPCHLLQLGTGRVLCTYGYRREPFGVRAVTSDDDGETWNMDRELVIRDDGTGRDLGYPSSVQLLDGRILSLYYLPDENDVRYIAGSIYSESDL